MNNFAIFERFNYFQDDLLKSVSIKYSKETGLRDCEIVIDSGDWILDVWGTVTILVSNVSSYRIQDSVNHSIQVISGGFYLVQFGEKFGIDLSGPSSAPKTLEKLLSSDLFVFGEHVEVTMSDELLVLL